MEQLNDAGPSGVIAQLGQMLEDALSDNYIFTATTLWHYWEGLVTTVQLVCLALLIGLILAVPLAILRGSRRRWVKMPVYLYTYVFRGTPLLIQLYLIYYGVVFFDGFDISLGVTSVHMPSIQETWLWDYFRDPFVPALLAFVLNTAAYTTEIFHGAIQSTPKGEMEAARAYGMSRGKMMRRIILPSAFRRALPAYGNEVIFMLHASAICSVVTLLDLTGAARDIYARFYAPFEAFLFVAAIYLCLTFTIIAIFRQLEKRLLAHLKPLS
ncbi:arginine/ornithine transporter AotM [Cobetia sp. AM6]|jgi:arginine/ornithine transport system permease protein|nr:arginine/ornithine transporter AotM [Cobetia sp. AM6]|tara:strand:+ start:88686 stop:89492 length:807 start_codon:yes stop_codon:yes gene_type:complete